ncbi:KilA-N domain-containing protein [Trinickia dinghuensis]|uniref:KilA-N domain-containing protein n=1 Tax=Trinickia dinghuensis TaxID=2291023 RepID=A0A3D8JQ78_9BURK|nr:KilA-N domain-containing protein [Trinickia dinghuensis]RDU95177.1 KilA-N domain-containing protein [Trinickia dinghuensis]
MTRARDNAIRRDENGRYSVNDLHRAGGGMDKHRPTYWLANQKTKDLCKEIEIDGIPSIQSKQGLGTFVARELVYAYAMWISTAFHLKTIRSFDAVVTGETWHRQLAALSPACQQRIHLKRPPDGNNRTRCSHPGRSLNLRSRMVAMSCQRQHLEDLSFVSIIAHETARIRAGVVMVLET